MMENPGNTVPAVLHHWATHQPDTAAFVFVNSAMKRRVLTRANVYRLASRFSAILRRDEVKRGDIICSTLPNSPERLVSDMGIILAGATAMHSGILLKNGEDFLGNLKNSRCTAVILDPLVLGGAATVLKPLQMEDGEDGKVRYKTLPALRRQYQCYWTSRGDQVSFMDMLEQEPDSYVADVTPDDMAYIWTTSGSTAYSKLVPRTHGEVLAFAERAAFVVGLWMDTSENPRGNRTTGMLSETQPISKQNCDGADSVENKETVSYAEDQAQRKPPKYANYVFFNDGKLGWSGGYPSVYFTVGATRVMLDLSTDSPEDIAELYWKVICQERCGYALIPPIYIQQILSKQLWTISSWKCRVVLSGGQPIHRVVVRGCLEQMTESFRVGYGTTDFGPIAMDIVTDPKLFEDCKGGKPLYGVELKVVDENMQEIPPGSDERGEILVRSSLALKYYVGNEEATRKTILADGWCRTGDVGYISDQGEVFVFCRTSFAIMCGASVIYPGWLETSIRKHPAVQEVVVVPVPAPVVHQEMCACVVPIPEAEVTETELKKFCEDFFQTSRKGYGMVVPRHFLFFSKFPTTATGKPCRRSIVSEVTTRLSM